MATTREIAIAAFRETYAQLDAIRPAEYSKSDGFIAASSKLVNTVLTSATAGPSGDGSGRNVDWRERRVRQCRPVRRNRCGG